MTLQVFAIGIARHLLRRGGFRFSYFLAKHVTQHRRGEHSRNGSHEDNNRISWLVHNTRVQSYQGHDERYFAARHHANTNR
jgi:hypothetical protein